MPRVDLEAEEVILRAFESATGPACVTCSFQAEDMALLHLLRRVNPGIPVLFLDTGYHFPETYAYRDRMAREWALNLVNLKPALTVEAQEGELGKLYQSEPDRCCKLRKVEPLMSALASFDLWFTGLRREQSPTRANLAQFDTHVLPSGTTLSKVSPLAAWTWKEVWTYLTVSEIEPLPLYHQGYTSIGCAPCTTVPVDALNPRSGRWGGVKLECGIHGLGSGG